MPNILEKANCKSCVILVNFRHSGHFNKAFIFRVLRMKSSEWLSGKTQRNCGISAHTINHPASWNGKPSRSPPLFRAREINFATFEFHFRAIFPPLLFCHTAIAFQSCNSAGRKIALDIACNWATYLNSSGNVTHWKVAFPPLRNKSQFNPESLHPTALKSGEEGRGKSK